MGFLSSGKFILILGIILLFDASAGLFFPYFYDFNTEMFGLQDTTQSPIPILFGAMVIGIMLIMSGLANFNKEF